MKDGIYQICSDPYMLRLIFMVNMQRNMSGKDTLFNTKHRQITISFLYY